jgi:hypothetical protein
MIFMKNSEGAPQWFIDSLPLRSLPTHQSVLLSLLLVKDLKPNIVELSYL